MQGSRQEVLFASAGESSLWKVVQGLRPTVFVVAGCRQVASCVAPRSQFADMSGRSCKVAGSFRIACCVAVVSLLRVRVVPSPPPPLPASLSGPLVRGVGRGRVARLSGVGTRWRTANLSVEQVV